MAIKTPCGNEFHKMSCVMSDYLIYQNKFHWTDLKL